MIVAYVIASSANEALRTLLDGHYYTSWALANAEKWLSEQKIYAFEFKFKVE